MQEIFSLIAQRVNSVSELSKMVHEISQKLASTQSNDVRSTKKEFMAYLAHLRREEKTRILRENEFLELIFTLRNYDDSQLLIFHETSYLLMQKMFPTFSYENYEANGTVKSIAKVYLKFFQALNMSSKVEDLKKAYNTNKNLNTGLNEKQNQFENPSLAISINRNGQPLNSEARRQGLGSYADTDERSNSNNFFVIRTREQSLGARRESNRSTFDKSGDGEISHEKSFDFYRRPSSRHYPQGEAANQTKDQLIAAANRLSDSEYSRLRAVPVCVSSEIISQKNNNYFDILGDLDLNVLSTTFQSQIYKASSKKKSKDGELAIFTIDFERKREMIIQQYQASFSRNYGVERSRDNYKKVMLNKKRIKYDPLESQFKGENYLEQYSILTLFHRFANFIEPSFKSQSPLMMDFRPLRAQSVQRKRQNLLQPPINQHQMSNSRRLTSKSSIRENSEDIISISQEESPQKSSNRMNVGTLIHTSDAENDKSQNYTLNVVENRPKEANLSFSSTTAKHTTCATTYKERPKTDLKSIKLDGFSLSRKNRAVPAEKHRDSIDDATQLPSKNITTQSEFVQRSTSTGARQRNSKLIINVSVAHQNAKQTTSFSPFNSTFTEKYRTGSNSKFPFETKVHLNNSAVDAVSQQLIAEIISKNPRGLQQNVTKTRPASLYRRPKHYIDYSLSQITYGHEHEHNKNIHKLEESFRTPEILINHTHENI